MAATKPELGDLIEIFRGSHKHWAIYVGEGFVIHLAPPSEHAQAGAHSMSHDKATVKKEELDKVVGNDKYSINNLLDKKYEPRPVQEIRRDARSSLGKELPSCVSGNCEHFVTKLRYGKPQPRQVQKVVESNVDIGLAVAAIFGVIVVAAVDAIFGSKDKQKKDK